jgi:type II secretory pathway pseudopilin PulG
MRAVNLIPVEDREGAAVGAGRSEGAAYAVMALILGIALMIALYGSAKKQVESRTSQAASVAAQAQSAQAQATQLASYTTFAALHEQREQAVDTLVDSRFDWAHAFHELGRVITPFVTINSLSGTVGTSAATVPTAAGAAGTAATAAPAGAAATGASSVSPSTPPGAVPTFSLVGCAITQKDVADFLVRLRLMDGVSQVALTASTLNTSGNSGCGTKSYSFTLTVTFDPLPTTAAETASAIARKPKTVANTAPSAPARSATGASAPSSGASAASGSSTGSVSAATSAAVAASGSTPTTTSTTTSAASAPSGSSSASSSSQSSTPAASTSGSVVR